MKKEVTQDDIDASLGRVNQYFTSYMERFPEHHLRTQTNRSRGARLVLRNSFHKSSEENGLTFQRDAIAYYCSDDDVIFVIKENMEKFIASEEAGTKQFRPDNMRFLHLRMNPNFYDFVLDATLMHESIHRSCKTTILQGAVGEAYRNASRVFFDAAASKKKLQIAMNPRNSLQTKGLALRYVVERSRNWLSISSIADELLTNYLAARIMAFSKPPYFPEQKKKDIFLNTIVLLGFDGAKPDESAEFLNNLVKLPGRKRLIADYLDSIIPYVIYSESHRNNKKRRLFMDAVLQQTMGSPKSIDSIINLSYNR
jgi:hypothetical protein